jgi:hypothetical protein
MTKHEAAIRTKDVYLAAQLVEVRGAASFGATLVRPG